MYLRMFIETSLKYSNSECYYLLIIPEENKESQIVNSILKKESEFLEDKSFYGTKEEIKESDDFFPFVLLKLSVPSTLKE